MYRRLCNLSKSNSFFLFGPRGCGKSTLLHSIFPRESNGLDILWIDLLNLEEELKYKTNPQLLVNEYEALTDKPSWIIIDEVQKVPSILDAVHQLIEKHKVKFALTGSSARKLKRAQANMLAGRAFNFSLFTLSFVELENDFILDDILSFGGLPKLYSSELEIEIDKKRYLKSYVSTYIKEEIIIEQLIRKIEPFYRFLEVAAQVNGEILNYSKIAREAKVSDKSVMRYFDILADTLMGFYLPSYHKSVRKQQLESSRFYFFDIGVVRTLRNQINNRVSPKTYDYGKLFEAFIINEVYKLNKYYETDHKLFYLKTKDGVEVDLIVETGRQQTILIEIKSKEVFDIKDVKSLNNISQAVKGAQSYVFCTNQSPVQLSENIKAVPWQDGIKQLFESHRPK